MKIDTTKGNPAMNYREHVKTYDGFIKASKYSTVIIIGILALMAVFLV